MSEPVPLNYERLAQIDDLFEAILSLVADKELDFDVVMHALTRAVAYGGINLFQEEEMAKPRFVAQTVEALSQHYDDLLDSYKRAQEMENNDD